jgi:hypothetical protein
MALNPECCRRGEQGAYNTRGDGLFSPEKEEQKMLVGDFYNLLSVGN